MRRRRAPPTGDEHLFARHRRQLAQRPAGGARSARRSLRAVIGLDRNVDHTRASCRFHVRVGGQDVFATGVLRANAAPRAIDVPLDGAKEFDLMVDEAATAAVGTRAIGPTPEWCSGRLGALAGRPAGGWPLRRSRSSMAGSFLGVPSASGTARSKTRSSSDTTSRRTLDADRPGDAAWRSGRSACLPGHRRRRLDPPFHEHGATRTRPSSNRSRRWMPAVAVGAAASVVLHRLNGAPCAGRRLDALRPAAGPGQAIDFAATDGRSSNVSPLFNLDWGSGGVITAIGWSGQWSASVRVQRRAGSRTQAGHAEAAHRAASGRDHPQPAHPAALLAGRRCRGAATTCSAARCSPTSCRGSTASWCCRRSRT